MTDTSTRDADAVRYAVLRKLASGMRHALVSELQTVQFTAELAARMQETGVTDAKLAECLQRMAQQTRAAVDSVRAMTECLRPDDNATTTVGLALQQCLRLAGDDWRLRGIEASVDVRTGPVLVAKAALHELLLTSLVALVDMHPGAIDIEVTAETAGADVIVSLEAKRADRKSPFPPLSIYRAMTGEDVATVGRAHGVACTCDHGAVTLRLPTVASA